MAGANRERLLPHEGTRRANLSKKAVERKGPNKSIEFASFSKINPVRVNKCPRKPQNGGIFLQRNVHLLKLCGAVDSPAGRLTTLLN